MWDHFCPRTEFVMLNCLSTLISNLHSGLAYNRGYHLAYFQLKKIPYDILLDSEIYYSVSQFVKQIIFRHSRVKEIELSSGNCSGKTLIVFGKVVWSNKQMHSESGPPSQYQKLIQIR